MKLALEQYNFFDYGINSTNGKVKPEEIKNKLNYAHSKKILIF